MIRSLHDYIEKHALLRPGDRVGVAVSGGADSVALLRLLLEARAELGIVLSVVHFNHKLRGPEAEQDGQFVAELASNYDLEIYRSEADTRTFAREKDLSIEAAARELRYKFFGQLIKDGILNKVATAHTLDDQAETVLLRIFRGTGTSGLAGILPRLKIAEGAVIRPLLSTRRDELRSFLSAANQPWREDSSNAETTFTRNRLRHELLPAIATGFNPDINEAISNLAEIARSEDELWSSQTADAFVRCQRQGRTQLTELMKFPKALQRRVVRLAAVQKGLNLDFAHGERILDLLAARSAGEKTIELPSGFRALIGKSDLSFEATEPQAKPCGFSYRLSVPGETAIPELRILIRATLVTGQEEPGGYNDDRRWVVESLALQSIAPELVLRNWRPGDRFWPAHTRSEKKVKELLQERHLPAREKSLWPVALAGDSIVWMRGFPVSARHLAKDEPAVLLEELPLTPDRL